MVRGVELFSHQLETYSDRYVVIGGTACSIAMEQAGLVFRATKDIDIVLVVEALDREFVDALWDFIRAGRYQNQHKSTGKKQFYRFHDPEDESYPVMMELFSRTPDSLQLPDDSRLTPIPVDQEASSLSAILMDDGYYQFIQEGTHLIDRLPVVRSEYLIPLKARAWMDLTERKAAGEKIDGKDIRKHRNDVFRLYQVIAPDAEVPMPQAIREDMRHFLSRMEADQSIDLKNLGLKRTTLSAAITSNPYAIMRRRT